ncbi:MAG: type II/IV secretion system protein [Candidatus Margulisbacteria bacterium]|nr:type II/IV secretion system protein [Candidatus Margulisiibacteriota bacterium]
MSEEFKELVINENVIRMLPEDIVRKNNVIPLALEGNNLKLGMIDPDNFEAIDEVQLITGCIVVSEPIKNEQLGHVIEKYFNVHDSTKQTLIEMRVNKFRSDNEKKPIEQAQDKLSNIKQKPVVKILDSIITDAITKGISDIHFDPKNPEMRVRYRMDGILHDAMTIPHHLEVQLISRIKLISNMDITEKMKPQDGQLSYKIQDKSYDIRVSCLPIVGGEKVVMRILDKSNLGLDLKDLGFVDDEIKTLLTMIKKPYGMILVTGPTGSGKITTLYSLLNQMNTITDNIMTIEDPVEYRLEGINQAQVNQKAGITFASALRSFLRQDPNVILVGEIRDKETAEIAIQAALTGHLVISTLHTNDAPSAVNRLIDMGVEPFLIASTIIGILAQRLLRTICVKCKGKGCPQCFDIGMKGRTGIYEILPVTDKIQKLIFEVDPTSAIKDEMMKSGIKTLQINGEEKIKQGLVSREEVTRVVLMS